MSEMRDSSTTRSARINLRVDPAADELLRSAAGVLHKSLSAFMLDSSLERAHQVMDEDRRLVLQAVEFERLLEQLDRPARVVPALVRLAERVAARSSTATDLPHTSATTE